MSQFMLCKTKNNLKKRGFIKLIDYNNINKEFLINVALEYFENESLNELWIFESIDRYCIEAQNNINLNNSFKSTQLYSLLEYLYNNCTHIIFWYGNDFFNLDVIKYEKGFYKYIFKCIIEPRCEVYLNFIKFKSDQNNTI